MIKAELSYNPYLLETAVKFNGSAPKINSLVEKHLTGMLQKWVGRIPAIFYDEMNGYGFDLEFTGTIADFEALQATFDAQRISRESVRLVHKNELEDAYRKSEELDGLLDWLQSHPNRRFDYPAFRDMHTALLDTDYEFVVMQGGQYASPFPDVAVETVSGTDELAQTDLENTPILFCVSEQSRAAFERNLSAVLRRNDVTREQLFFLIDQFPDRFRVERFLADSGIKEPQFVRGPDDERIKQYIARYPVTEYIRQAIAVFRRQEETLKDILRDEDQRSMQTNGDLQEKIEALDRCICLLRAAHERIVQRDYYHCPDALTIAKAACLTRLQDWRKKKIKMTDDAEAARAADAFEAEAQAAFAAFVARAWEIFFSCTDGIRFALTQIYASAEYDDEYNTSEGCGIDLTAFHIPELAPSLLTLFTEQYAEPKNAADFLGSILKNLPVAAQSKQKEPVRLVSYLYSDWRQYTADMLAPVLDDVITRVFETLSAYYTQVAADYLGHLDTLVRQQTNARRKTAAQLSDDEQKLHADHVWFTAFQEKLREIERA
ncbi:MAG: hypothetical protein LBJ11_06145 [Oscillospiraceae bacterium]|jgi:hypothetical protein|nr:hypothetical protein [Oscillospiraceae bacterium]